METFFVLLFSPQVCFATVFGTPGDKWAGGPAACTQKEIADHRESETMGIAHRTLPCGSKVKITNPRNGKTAKAVVVDRGPYGAGTPGHDWYVKRKKDEPPPNHVCRKINDPECLPRKWRGCVDLLPAVGKKIGLKGRGEVLLEVLD